MNDSMLIFPRTALKPDADYLAPDGSEIRLLPTMKGGGLCHCTLPEGKISSPVSHRHVEEIWYILEGEGEVWRKAAGAEKGITVPMSAGTSLTIPPRTSFQFRNTGSGPLCILIATMPPWPGPEGAVEATGAWSAAAGPDTDAGPVSIVADTGMETRGRSEHK